jgi:hypothetical protein
MPPAEFSTSVHLLAYKYDALRVVRAHVHLSVRSARPGGCAGGGGARFGLAELGGYKGGLFVHFLRYVR